MREGEKGEGRLEGVQAMGANIGGEHSCRTLLSSVP